MLRYTLLLPLLSREALLLFRYCTAPALSDQRRTMPTCLNHLHKKSPLVAPVESLQVIAKELLPYEIKRRPNSGWLPVYSAYRNGRSRKITLVRDVRGSMDHFVRDLSKLVPEDRMKIKSAGTKLEIVGDYTGPIRDWLRARSF
ncbi:hypothetical protein BSLG_001950 [Batrachochytrium salamandrivorans]|nr:hypothetical protein BSLG_001950 [Batrachochytrium salamandrivorans]